MLPKSEGRRYSYRFNNPQKEEAKMLLKEKIRLLSMVDVLEPLSQKELEDFSERIPDTTSSEARSSSPPRIEARHSSYSRRGG